MKFDQLITILREKQINVSLNNDKLKIAAKDGVLTPEIIASLKEHKAQLIKELRQLENRVENVISSAEDKPFYMATPAQRRLYFLWLLDPGSIAYNMTFRLKLPQEISADKIENILQKLIDRHEMLRTTFCMEGEQIVQKINKEITFSIEKHAVDTPSNSIVRPFNLNKDLLLRAAVLFEQEIPKELVIDMHHIISDGVSGSILIQDFQKLEKNETLPPLTWRFRDYSEWLNSDEQQKRIKNKESYWLEQYSELPLEVDFPIDNDRPLVRNSEGASTMFSLSGDEYTKLKQLTDQNDTTLFMSLLSVVSIWISKLTGSEDIVIGTPVSGRTRKETTDLVGLFINTLAVRTKPTGTKRFNDFLSEVKGITIEMLESQEYPFENLIEKLGVSHDSSRNPLFDVLYSLQRLPGKAPKIITGEHVNGQAKVDLTIEVSAFDDKLVVNLSYAKALYLPSSIDRFVGYFKKILNELVKGAVNEISALQVLSQEEKEQQIFEFNQSEVKYPHDKSIGELFSEWVEKTPTSIALVINGRSYSYQEMNGEVNRLANFLSTIKGVSPKSPLAIQLERNEWYPFAILAAVKLGVAYVPLDVGFPKERTENILSQAKCEWCVDEKLLGDFMAVKSTISSNEPTTNATPDTTAYIMFTSGSTGKPKGVVIPHRAVIRLVKNPNYVELEAGESVLGLSTFAFDASTFDLFMPLLNGGKSVIAPKNVFLDLEVFENLITEHEIKVLFTTTALFNNLVEEEPEALGNIRELLFGGEKTSLKHVAKFQTLYPKVNLKNVYGPTENTTFSNYFPIDSKEKGKKKVPIGRPISNSTCYILDKYGHLMPIGTVGEICVGGEGLAKGYLNNAQLTREKFIDHPFISSTKLYRTGDTGKWTNDGDILFTGRVDHQVKIRGHRIEPGEIEQVLLKHEVVEEAIVLVHEDHSNEKVLVLYFACKSVISVDEVKIYLRQFLPEYMIPAHCIRMEEMPLNSNGKIDRSALVFEIDDVHKEVEKPTNKIEEQLLSWCEELLSRKNIGIRDNFFELGGHSLKLMKLLSRIEERFSVKLPVSELYRSPDIRQMAQLIADGNSQSYAPIPKAREKEFYNLTSSQKRLFLLQKLDPESVAYNIPLAIPIRKDIEIRSLEDALKKLISRHEILRTSFHVVNGEPVQKINATVDFKLESLEGDSKSKEIVDKCIRPFNLGSAPLCRGVIVKNLVNGESTLMLDMHHLVSDGHTHEVLTNEFKLLFEGKELPTVNVQYRDYAEWLNSAKIKQELERQESYWLETFKTEAQVLELPTDFPRPLIANTNGKSVSILLNEEVFGNFSKWCLENGITHYMGFISITSFLLSRLCKTEDVTIGSPVSGRGHRDLEQLVGVLINTIVIRNRPEAAKTINEFIQDVKESVLTAFNNQEYPFEQLVEKVLSSRDQSRNPLFDVMFVMQNQSSMIVDTDSYGIHQENQQAKLDLTIEVIEQGTTASLGITYATDLFLPETIDRFLEYFKVLLGIFPASDEVSLNEISFIDKEEKTLLLESINSTGHAFLDEKTLIDLFEERVSEIPNETAIVFEGKTMTFDETNLISNQLSNFLFKNKRVGHGDIVAIKLERSEWLPISMLAIMKSGAAYLPIPPDFPESRVEYMLENSGSKITVDEPLLKEFFSVKDQLPMESIDSPLSSDDLVYVLYTSGSTGNPKGCMLNHRGVVNRIDWMWNEFGFKQGEAVLQKTTFTFDVSVWEFFLPLCWGNTMVMCTSEDIQSPLRLRELIKTHGINTLHFVPSMFTAFIQNLDQSNRNELVSLSRVITSGEALSSVDVNNWYEFSSAPIHNLYGPTEASIDVSYYTAKKGDTEIPIGKPIWNTQLYVLGEQQELLPFGVPGEICIGGIGLAQGYLENETLTNEKFIENPHSRGTLIYRTGDIGKWRHDGQLMYLDRLDHQVKIRGYRIEIGEIEEALRLLPSTNEVAVLVSENEVGEKSLTAYVAGDVSLNIRDLRSGLLKSLPDYMVPAHFLRVDSLPLTSNGKLDRKTLSKLAVMEINTGAEYEEPRNDFEKAITTIWCSVLSREKISIHERFFELGGDSIKILRLAGMIQTETGYDIPLRELYTHDSIAVFTEYVARNRESLLLSKETAQSQVTEIVESFEALKHRILLSEKLSDAKEIEDIYPMSAIEKGMIFESVADPLSGMYHDQAFYKRSFSGFDFMIFEQALKKLVNKHPILRTAYNLVDFEEEIHLIYKEIDLPIEYFDVSHYSSEVQQKQIKEYLTDQREKPFETTKAPLWRMTVYQMSSDMVGFAWQFHHAILDGWSNASLVTELNNCYVQLIRQSDYQLSPLSSSYKDFIVQSVIKRSDENLQQFWSNELSHYSKPELFTDEVIHEEFLFQLSDDQLKRMKDTSDKLGVTVKTFSLAVYIKMLGLLVTDDELLIGMVTNTRPAKEDAGQILGCFLNTIPLRMNLKGHASAGDFVKELNNKVIELRGKEHLEFFDIVKLLDDQTGQGAPLFDTLFNYIDFHVFDELDSSGNISSSENDESLDWEMTNTFLDFSINRTGGTLAISMTLNRKLKVALPTQRLGKLYLQLLEFMTANTDDQFTNIDILTPEERALLERFNDTDRDDTNEGKTVLELFQAQVRTHPEKIMLQENKAVLSYKELDQSSNKLAFYLSSKHEITSGHYVGIKLARSTESVVAMLAVLKTGAAYIPIDVNYPQERIAYMIENSGCNIVIDDEFIKQSDRVKTSEEYLGVDIDPSDTAYVIYTSGSTGRPKGVEISHASLMDYTRTVTDTFELNKDDVVLHQASISFDVSIEEIYPALLAGSKLLIANDKVNDIEALMRLIENEKITFVSTTPLVISEFNQYPEKFRNLRVLISGGDELKKIHCDRLVDQLELYNTYGPTEATVCATYHKVVNSNESVLIGSPIPNHKIYVLDRDGVLLPPGVLGEICIGGAGVAKGYLKNDVLTKERFIANPFLPNERMYLSGDLGRWLPDGRIAFAGRVDEQLKIRGYRIEPGEIEAAFLSLGIDTIVMPYTPKDGQKQLVVYLKGGEDIEIPEIKEKLRKGLPEFMIPSYFIPIESFALTPNGKVDKRSLPSPNKVLHKSGAAYIAAEDEIQEMLVKIWSDVLDRDGSAISVLDNFFEIGGDSIRILKVLHKLKEEGIEDISVAVLFQYPSIEKLGRYLKDAQNGEKEIEEIDFESRDTLMDSMQLLLGEEDE